MQPPKIENYALQKSCNTIKMKYKCATTIYCFMRIPLHINSNVKIGRFETLRNTVKSTENLLYYYTCNG